MNDKQYKRIAEEYLRGYGAQLRDELDALERGGTEHITPSLDRRVRRGIAALKRPRLIRYTGLVAACLAIALLTPFVLRLNQGRVGEQSPGIYSPNETQDGGSRAPAEPSDQAPGLSTDAPAKPGYKPGYKPGDEPGTATTAPGSEDYEVLPLSFQIPARFTVASVEQDVGRTVYHLRDDYLDDVVLTLERPVDISWIYKLVEVPVGSGFAFAGGGDGYNLLAIMDYDSDILYTLTCRFDVNTLVLLGSNIV